MTTAAQAYIDERLKQYKTQGMSAQQAVQALKAKDFPANYSLKQATCLQGGKVVNQVSAPSSDIAITAKTLGAALTAVFDSITPLDMARILKNEFAGSPGDVAQGVAYAFPELSALAVGKLLLDAQVYPGLDKDQMRDALLSADFSAQDVNAAIATLYGQPAVNVTVRANIKWQNSGVSAGPQVTITVTYQSGQWTANPATGYVNAAGNPRFIAKPGYTMPGQYEGALIGRVGTRVFLVGAKATVPGDLSGPLELCINDDLDGRYGAGFTDNQGAIVVGIATAPR
jgi:hypothetical protein